MDSSMLLKCSLRLRRIIDEWARKHETPDRDRSNSPGRSFGWRYLEGVQSLPHVDPPEREIGDGDQAPKERREI